MPERDKAAAALAELEAGKRVVANAEVRARRVLLATYSVSVLADYLAKDLLVSRRAKWTVTAGCQLSTLGAALWDLERNPVQPVSLDPADVGPRAAAPFFGAMLGWALAERLLVVGLRHSRSLRPNTLAGGVLAVARPIAYVSVMRLVPRPGRHE